MGNYHIKTAAKKAKTPTLSASSETNEAEGKKNKVITNDELAVIAMALYKYSESIHDYENMSLTINKVSKTYSPWSSKIYGLRQYPNRK
jgi:hypothetical protein